MEFMVLERAETVTDFHLRKGQPGTVQRTMQLLGRATLSPGAVQMHKIAVREKMINQLPAWKKWLISNRFTSKYLAQLVYTAFFATSAFYLALVLMLPENKTTLGAFSVMFMIGGFYLGTLAELPKMLTWSVSDLETSLNPDIPPTGKVLTRALQQILGEDAKFMVHRLGPDPFLEVHYHGESAFYFGWDDAAELVDVDGEIQAVCMK